MLLCNSAISEARHWLAANSRAALIPELGNEGSGIKPVVLGDLFFRLWKSLLAGMLSASAGRGQDGPGPRAGAHLALVP